MIVLNVGADCDEGVSGVDDEHPVEAQTEARGEGRVWRAQLVLGVHGEGVSQAPWRSLVQREAVVTCKRRTRRSLHSRWGIALRGAQTGFDAPLRASQPPNMPTEAHQ